MVGLEDPEVPPPDDGVAATVPTEAITPGVVWLLGSVMVTLSPTATSDCAEASRAMLTWRVIAVAVSTEPTPPPVPPLPPGPLPALTAPPPPPAVDWPIDTVTEVTRIGPGSKTT